MFAHFTFGLDGSKDGFKTSKTVYYFR
jgi:hypothetical protein